MNVTFGSYTFDTNERIEYSQESRVSPVLIPRKSGYKTDQAYETGIRILISGSIVEDTEELAREELNKIRLALMSGKQYLNIYGTREILCQKNFFTTRYIDSDVRAIEWEAELISDEHVFRSTSATEAEFTITASPATNTFTNSGNAVTPITIRITAGSSAITSGLQIDNVTTGESFTYNESIAIGKYIEIDTDNLSVIDSDGNNKIGSFSQDFFKLAVGDNDIKWTGTATGSPKLKLTYNARYYGP